ncbi:hypothetical protein NDU88_001663 [Pleurodeles waltl]|uniref:Uncharacterized protein n=1 Tax=Pleurodeles waltl TaxID=8319 RepID=A0AAV7KQ38_PLEWA|nr:hypothetical protein NDU88_001663 [Pleurodeles waltl]
MDGVRVPTSTRPSCPHNRGPRPQRALCSVAAAILGCGSRKVFGGSFPGDLCSRVGLRFLLVLYILRSLLFNPQDLRSSLWQVLNFGLDCGPEAPRYAAFADVPLHTVALAVCGEGV